MSVAPSPLPGPNSGSLNVPRFRCPLWLSEFRRSLARLQVSHYGYKYSLERLLALDEHSILASTAGVHCHATTNGPGDPFSRIAAPRSLRVADPEDEWKVQYGFGFVLLSSVVPLVIRLLCR